MAAPAVTTPSTTTAGTPSQVTPPTTGKSPATTPPPVAGKTEAKPNLNVFKIKVHGVESEVGVDQAMPELAEVWPTLSDDAKRRVIAMHQKDVASSKRLEEAHKLREETKAERQEVESVIHLLREGTDEEVEAALKRMGRDTRMWAENFLAKKLQREMMDPKDRELQDAKAERDRLLAEDKARRDEAEKADNEKKVSDRAKKIKDTIAGKINEVLKDSELPANDRTVGKIAFYMQQAIKAGDPVDVEEIREQVAKDYKADFGHVFKDATPSQIVSIIGEEKLKEIRKWDNERITGKGRKPEEKTGPAGARSQMKKKFKTPEQDNLERFGTIYPNIQD